METKNISKESIARYLPKNPVIVEAGAHIGRDTIKMHKAWPTSTIHAFEPVPELYSYLIDNTAPYPKIFCYPLALSNVTGESTFFVSSGRSTATSSFFEAGRYQEQFPDTLFSPSLVQTITLDEWTQLHSIMHVDALWLDMQGAELQALQGALKMLSNISVIHTEVNLTERYKGIPLYPEIKQWLLDQGFTIAHETFPHPEWGNILFVR